MPLSYYPPYGEVVQCDFKGMIMPEVVKLRPVVVVGPRLKNGGDLVRIVPLSTSQRPNPHPWQVKVTLLKQLPEPFDSLEAYALCNHVFTAARSRLDRFKMPRPRYGGRPQRIVSGISKDDLCLVRAGILTATKL